MATRLQTARAEARGSLHREMAIPALYIVGDAEPVEVTVRLHSRMALTGDISGLATVAMRDIDDTIRFLTSEVALPARGAIVSVAAGEAYRLGDAHEPYGLTIDAAATRLTATEADGLPVPE